MLCCSNLLVINLNILRVTLLFSFITYQATMSRDSSVGIATGYGLVARGVGIRVPVGSRIFSSLRRPDRLWGPPTSYPMGTGDSFPWDKATGA
jgi:hypothetical protein